MTPLCLAVGPGPWHRRRSANALNCSHTHTHTHTLTDACRCEYRTEAAVTSDPPRLSCPCTGSRSVVCSGGSDGSDGSDGSGPSLPLGSVLMLVCCNRETKCESSGRPSLCSAERERVSVCPCITSRLPLPPHLLLPCLLHLQISLFPLLIPFSSSQHFISFFLFVSSLPPPCFLCSHSHLSPPLPLSAHLFSSLLSLFPSPPLHISSPFFFVFPFLVFSPPLQCFPILSPFTLSVLLSFLPLPPLVSSSPLLSLFPLLSSPLLVSSPLLPLLSDSPLKQNSVCGSVFSGCSVVQQNSHSTDSDPHCDCRI